MQIKSLAGLTALMLAVFALLIGLGVWQLQRLHWKEGLIAEIETRTKGEPVSLADALELAAKGEGTDYLRIKARGRFDHEHELYLYAINADGEPGWHVITPLDTATGELLLVDRGFVPEPLRDPASRPQGQLKGEFEVIGLARPAEAQGLFLPDNDAERNRWFYRDLNGMVASIHPTATLKPVPVFLEAEKSDIPGGWPQGGQTRLELPNNHLQYALTWFLMAGALLIVYGAYLRSRYRPVSPLE